MADEVVPGAVSDEAARGKAVGDLGREVERLTHLAGELQRLLEMAILERDRHAGEVKRLRAEVDRLVADRLGAYAAELAKVEAERDAATAAADDLEEDVARLAIEADASSLECFRLRAERDAVIKAHVCRVLDESTDEPDGFVWLATAPNVNAPGEGFECYCPTEEAAMAFVRRAFGLDATASAAGPGTAGEGI